ncbi:hypothetical protein FB192DRAFT_1325069 [Mucor lusitanicus]|uniref:BZIP domain-containing protein n=1 Tax=Mucor circinelloides f. lusitanicus TaxID=29924 RepID=A0A8H4BGE3_MUCCL|nr:hypothetical protein FB192DRAFT_1325069 [Mucor lusitanicus]
MDFEDIVDMDWLNSHTIDSTSLPSPPFLKDEDFNMDYQHSFSSQQMETDQLVVQDAAEAAKDMMVMPTTEQIKQLIELAKRQLALREQLAASDTPPLDNSKRESSHEIEGPISLEAYAETGGIDIKKLTSKERRQLRNKISARNFRVRRKEYITTLEGQVNDHKKANEQLLHRLNAVEEENKQLRMQLDSLKRQNHQLVGDTNLDKDLSILGSKASDTYRQDTSILVS